MRVIVLLALCAGILPIAAGCSSGDDEPVVGTGWSGPLTGFTRIDGQGELGSFVRGSGHPPLQRIFVARPEVVIAPGSTLGRITEADLDRVRGELQRSLEDALNGSFDLVASLQPDVYILRTAVTGVRIISTDRNALPTGSTELRFVFSESVVEAELRAASDNGRVAVVIARAAASEQEAGTRSWTDVRAALGERAALLRERLVKLREYFEKEPKAAPPKAS